MTEYYVQLAMNGWELIEVFWAVGQGSAHQHVIPSELGTHQEDTGEDILTTLQKRFPGSLFHLLQLGPGEYFPRMARPQSTAPGCSPGKNPDNSPNALNARTTSTGQLHALILKLQDICRVVHPVEQNMNAYGHEIRNFLMIACTEVEAQWKGILTANGRQSKTRHDYVKLSPAMKLEEYRVALTWYPWLDPIAPFEGWTPSGSNEKQHLPWYDAYNAAKHDREQNFAEAKLEYAIESLTACFVMLCAQYGLDFVRAGEEARDVFFRLVACPTWSPSDLYVPSYGATARRKNYPFGS
jgi:hypothetical protein